MKFSISFKLFEECIPKDYRRGFASVLKNALSKGDYKLYEFFYEGKYKLKPFTFSVFFPEGSKLENDKFKVGKEAILKFSTNQPTFAVSIYNGLLELSSKPIPFFNNHLQLNWIRTHSIKKIYSNEVKVKTISPILVTNKGCHIYVNGKTYDIYLEPNDEGFDEGLKFLIQEQVKHLMNFIEPFPFEYEFIKNTIKIIPVWHYHQWNKSIKGELILRSHPQIIQLLYDTGIGARRSQGFGMLEVIEQ